MCTYPSSEDVQGATYYYYPGRWIQFQDRTYSAQFPLQGSIPCRVAYRGIQANTYTTYILHILPGTHLYTWVESSNVVKVSCWRTKVPGIDGNWTRNPDPESRVHSNIPQHLHSCIKTNLGCVYTYFAKAESAFWNANSKRWSKTPFTQANVRAQPVYMTFKRGYMWFCVHASTRIMLYRKHIFGLRSCLFCEGVLKRWFKTPIQNRGSTGFREEDDTFTEEGMFGILGMFNSSSTPESDVRL